MGPLLDKIKVLDLRRDHYTSQNCKTQYTVYNAKRKNKELKQG